MSCKYNALKISSNEVKIYWDEQYYKSANECTHVFRQGHCSNIRSCEIGLRTRKFQVLAGSVLTVWTRVENVLSSLTGYSQFRLQIIRVKTNDDLKIIGCVIPNFCLNHINSLLESMSTKTYLQDHLSKSKENIDESSCILLDEEKKNELDDVNSKTLFNFNPSNEKNFRNIPIHILNYDYT